MGGRTVYQWPFVNMTNIPGRGTVSKEGFVLVHDFSGFYLWWFGSVCLSKKDIMVPGACEGVQLFISSPPRKETRKQELGIDQG